MTNKEQTKYLAQALFNVCQKRDDKQVDLVIANLLQLLRAQGRMDNLSEIIADLKDLRLIEQGIVKIKVSSAHSLKEAELKVLAKIAQQLTQANTEFETKVDSSLIGGVVLNYQDKLIDLSLRQKINKLSEALIN